MAALTKGGFCISHKRHYAKKHGIISCDVFAGWTMTELHCDNKRCVYHRDDHCAARAVYFLKGICQSVRRRIEVPPPMIGRLDTRDCGRPWNGKRWRVIK